ncbi:MAG: membrane protein insertion efficiency factor YidD [Helicobacteraceae bacterium]|jgi:putative membrane protein insertion efficiency factor|nr:membrane protein insertion efficiency factor YidD [Helicobacteraceae bacterium]
MQTPLLNRPFRSLVRLYQIVFSPFFGRSCRFYPSCSNYALWVLEKRALPIALIAIVWRLTRCNPLFKGGFDYPSTPRDKNAERKSLIFVSALRKTDKIKWFMIPSGNRYILIKGRKK